MGQPDLDPAAFAGAGGKLGIEFGIGQATEAGGTCLGFGDQLAGSREFGILCKREARGALEREGFGDGKGRE